MKNPAQAPAGRATQRAAQAAALSSKEADVASCALEKAVWKRRGSLLLEEGTPVNLSAKWLDGSGANRSVTDVVDVLTVVEEVAGTVVVVAFVVVLVNGCTVT